MSQYAERIRDHYFRIWQIRGEPVPFDKGPISDLGPDFCILRFPPTEDRGMWAYATQCMSRPGDRPGLELHLFTKEQTDSVCEILVATAHYDRTGRAVKGGDTVNFGVPWVPGANRTCGLISLPYLDGPDLEWLDIPPDESVRFLWLVPITQRQREYAVEFGIEALETQFDESPFFYMNEGRDSLV